MTRSDPHGSQAPHARRLRALRKAMGYNEIAGFADYLGVARPRLSNVESSGLPLGLDLARKIRAKTGASLDWLIEGDASNMPVELLRRIQEVDGGTERKAKTARS